MELHIIHPGPSPKKSQDGSKASVGLAIYICAWHSSSRTPQKDPFDVASSKIPPG